MRRAFSLKMGRPGPSWSRFRPTWRSRRSRRFDATPVKATRAGADPQDVDAAARVLLEARRPVILAGQGVLYAEATTSWWSWPSC